jgi:LPXTG-motif cell wall-anchored protein
VTTAPETLPAAQTTAPAQVQPVVAAPAPRILPAGQTAPSQLPNTGEASSDVPVGLLALGGGLLGLGLLLRRGRQVGVRR